MFVVGYLGDWKRAASVLFESQSLQGDLAKSRKERQRTTGDTENSIGNCSELYPEYLGNAEGGNTDKPNLTSQNTANGISNQSNLVGYQTKAQMDVHPPLRARDYKGPDNDHDHALLPCVPYTSSSFGQYAEGVGTLRAEGGDLGGGSEPISVHSMQVRRRTPTACERLQGFEDGHTKIPYRNKPADGCPDGPRYKALGNSMAVPVMKWIGERIMRTEKIFNELD